MRVKLQPIPANATQEVAVLSDVDYTSMTVTELKAECKAKGIEGYSTMTKAELIQMLETAQ